MSTKVHLIDAIVDVVEVVNKFARLVESIEVVTLASINRRIEAIHLRVGLGIELPVVRVEKAKLVVVQKVVIQIVVVKVIIEQIVVGPAVIELTVVELAVAELDSIKLAAVVQVIISAETKSASQVITLEHSCVWYSWDSVALGIWCV